MMKITIASVLKPIDDPRMLEKFGVSLSEANKYEVNIIGFHSKNIPIHNSIRFHPLFRFKRLDLKRVFAPFIFFKTILKVKPEVIILNTHELLLVTLLYKILFGSRIIYDIQENYFRNTLVNPGIIPFLRPLIAFYIRMKEHLSRLFIDHYILAEKGYLNELSFIGSKYTILENKYKAATAYQERKSKNNTHFLYSGTISENYGILEAIDFIEQLLLIEPTVHLTIIGFCQSPALLKQIKTRIVGNTQIQLIGGDSPVSHKDIIHEMSQADFGLCPYHLDMSIRNCIPTKYYEYIALQLPIIMTNHEPWNGLIQKYDAGISIDFNANVAEDVWKQLSTQSFFQKGIDQDIYWESEEKKLLSLMSKY